MEGKSILSLTTQIYEAISIELESYNELIVGFKFWNIKCMKKPIE